jgi:hypothetical protein
MNRALSVDEVVKLSHKPIILITAKNKDRLYSALDNAISSNKDKFILLHYQTSNNSKSINGHWVSMIIKPKIKQIWYFDSYGYFPDNQLENIPLLYRVKTNQVTRDVGIFLYTAYKKYGFKIRYNDVKLQRSGKNIATCGYYSAFFLRKNCTPEKMAYFLIDYSDNNKISPDRSVIQLCLQ